MGKDPNQDVGLIKLTLFLVDMLILIRNEERKRDRQTDRQRKIRGVQRISKFLALRCGTKENLGVALGNLGLALRKIMLKR